MAESELGGASASGGARGPGQGGPDVAHTIALVDDDRNILTSISMALESEGFKVQSYTDGASALRGIGSKPIDLAILDIKMPRMDGMELLQRLRRQSSCPVIFLTSKDEEVDEILGLRMGADDYIKKPFSQPRRWAQTRSRSSCRVIACSRPTARPAASPPTAASRPRPSCSPPRA